MFYSDTLLSKTGPLARVWLASNMERKLTKKDCLSSNLESSIEVMVDQGSAPMALRLSGQLLLGVCRIYSRKTRYLLEDCNEALLKIKMSFRPGNVDLPHDQIQALNPASLNLPDSLTDMDLLANIPDVTLLLESADLGRLSGETGLSNIDWGTQNLIPDSTGKSLSEIPRAYDDGDDLGLNLDDDDFPSGLDIEKGRDRVETTWADELVGNTSKLPDDDLGLNFDDVDETTNNFVAVPDDVDMTDINALDDAGAQQQASDPNDMSLYEPQEESVQQVAQRVKRRKVIALDSNLEINTSQMRDQQTDRSKTMRPMSFLPRDPLLLSLLSMQKSGGFISHILGNVRTSVWAPELRRMFSMEQVRRSGELKRKRDSGVSDMYLDDEQLGIEIPEDESILPPADTGDYTLGGMQEELPSMHYDDDVTRPMSPGGDFDETTMPLLHPDEAGPISQGTHHAVHLLRNHFGPEGENSPTQRQKSSVLFQELLPEKKTSRSEATKMFFEVLVLATKDAIKVEQKGDAIGGALRVRAKRGLWGAWAEQNAGGQIEETAQGGAEAIQV
jgi:cohesin complex subunit SCC1